MRITNKTLFDSVSRNLSKTATEMFRANQTVSSGKRIENPSDDPIGLVAVLDLRSSLANINQLQRNIDAGRSWLDMGESALTQVEDLLTQTKSLCVEMASETKGSTERRNAGTVVDGYLKQILSLANTQVNGRYIFAGTKTDTAPFTYDETGTPPNVVYQGNASAFSVKIGKDIDVEVGRDGETVFGDDGFDWSDPAVGHTNLFKTLIDLKTALVNNDVSGIGSAMDRLDSHLETLRTTISNTGGRILRLDTKEQIIQDLNLTYTDRMSSLEDADLAEAVLELKSKETVYQAALASSSQVMSLSLVDYL